MASSLPQFPPFDVHQDGNVGPRWKKWLSRFERLMIAMDISDPKRQRALLLHYSGNEVDEIFDTLQDTGEDDDYKQAVEKLNAYFTPKVNVAYEEYNFRQAKQLEGETLDCYHTRLRQLAQTCEFTNVDREIASQIILNCNSQRLRRRALRDDLSLQSLLDAGRALETSEAQATAVEGTPTSNHVNAVGNGTDRNASNTQHGSRHRSQSRGRSWNRSRKFRQNDNWNRNRSQSRRRNNQADYVKNDGLCFYCGKQYPHAGKCPAKGKQCGTCGKFNHFAAVCKSNNVDKRKVYYVNNTAHDQSDDDDYVYTLRQNESAPHCPNREILITDQPVSVMIDSGASVNILNDKTYNQLTAKGSGNGILQKPKTKLYAYGSTQPLPVLGVWTTEVKYRNIQKMADFHIVENGNVNLLSYRTASDLELMHIVNTVNHSPSTNAKRETENHSTTINAKRETENIVSEFSDLFSGIGKIKDKQVKLHIRDDVQPKQQPHRRIPFHVRKDVENELERLEQLDIIEKVDGPTPWVSPIVVVPKKTGGVRLCIDMREANKAIKREKHPMPTVDDLIADLNNASVFSKLDLTSGYHQLELAPESRNITTFSTHAGLRRYKRLLFGVNAASEIFQNEIAELLSDLPGCLNLSDDIIIFGSDQQQHDRNLRAVLQRLRENNVRLHPEKCSFGKSEIDFYGHTFSAKGISPDPSKVKAIVTADPPKTQSEVKSLLGMAQYVSRFIQGYATLTEPLRKLTHQDVEWSWGSSEQQALDDLKRALTGAQVMSYFDPKKTTEILVDASPVGIGAILCQEGKVVSYGSRALSSVEQRYSQTEREMLATVWGAEHFHLYVYGSKFSIVTDHKPLLGIFPSLKPASARIERWRLRLMPYDVKLSYRPGKDSNNPADYLSRHPVESCDTDSAEDYVNYVCQNAVPKAMTLDEVREETQKDQVMQKLIRAIETGQWHDDNAIQHFRTVKSELSVCNGLVLRGTRLVIPVSLQDRAVDLAHTGHQGIVKTKSLIREKVWFPHIDSLVESKVKQCIPCQASSSYSPKREPLIPSKLPIAAWKDVSVDFAGPFPSGDYLLVIIDDYSRFPEVEIISSTSARTVIPRMDAIFARQGIPETVRTDNGPPFNGHEFANFANYLGFHHRKVTPLWPEANGEAERFMETLNKAIRAASAEKLNWKQELFKFLRQYRATPHSSIGISPFHALTGRKMKTTLPEFKFPVATQNEQTLQRFITKKDRVAKHKMKVYADNKRNTRHSTVDIGDTVLVRQRKTNKLSTPFNPSPYRVVSKNGSMLTAQRGKHMITRNSTFFKPVIADCPNSSDEEEEDDEETFTSTPEQQPPTNPSLTDTSQPLRSCLRQATAPRQSGRARKLPVRFKDFVVSK